jgi:signal transduction histidine kinase
MSRAGHDREPTVEDLKRELVEAREQQAATSEILGIISRSSSDLQPVLDTIVATATRLCGAEKATIRRRSGDAYLMVAEYGCSPEQRAYMEKNPVAAGPGTVVGGAAETRKPVYVADVEADPGFRQMDLAKGAGFRAALAVPLLREGEIIGVLMLLHSKRDPFTADHIERAQSFADQAVIAIENTRLFEEVQARTAELEARNQELAQALEQQTATSEVLRVISHSPTDIQPVLDTVAESAARLCQALDSAIFRRDGDHLLLVAHFGATSIAPTLPLIRGTVNGRAVLEGCTIHLADIQAEQDEFPVGSALSIPEGVHTHLSIPLMRKGEAIGTINIRRTKIEPFTARQVALLETFADQAVIAIENVRLFDEVQARTRDLARSVLELKALREVAQTISSTLNLETVLNAILIHACRFAESGGGAIYVFDKARGELNLATGYNMSPELLAEVRKHPVRDSLVGQCAERREAVQIEDLTKVPPHPLFDMHIESGIRALLAVPLIDQENVVGALIVRRQTVGAFSIQNARLFGEIAQKSRELEIASQHKSQFVANMSHELRTPLAAMLGYAELLQEGIYGAPPEKFLPILTRIRSNGKHLLGLINTVLDISKIEAGQFKLNLGEYALGSIVETVMVATESLAATKKLAFKTEVAKGLPYGLGDEQRLTQVLLNLVGNAIKFTDAGEVRIAAGAANGHFTVSVSDTGPGIPPEERERIFEKFRQVDSSNTRAKGGTGLGLAIAREIVEMHGGRIWVESTMGQGSTFCMELPVLAAGAS